jgi:hypothetical protein
MRDYRARCMTNGTIDCYISAETKLEAEARERRRRNAEQKVRKVAAARARQNVEQSRPEPGIMAFGRDESPHMSSFFGN